MAWDKKMFQFDWIHSYVPPTICQNIYRKECTRTHSYSKSVLFSLTIESTRACVRARSLLNVYILSVNYQYLLIFFCAGKPNSKTKKERKHSLHNGILICVYRTKCILVNEWASERVFALRELLSISTSADCFFKWRKWSRN